LDKKKKSAVLAVLLGARPLADNRYSLPGRQSTRQNRQQIKPHCLFSQFRSTSLVAYFTGFKLLSFDEGKLFS
jgi:hypothetical protein